MRLLAALLCAEALAGCHVEADFSDALKTEVLSAEKYRGEITTIDRLVFRPAPLGDDGVRTLRDVLTALSKKIVEKPDSKFLKIESLEIRLLAERAAHLSPRGNGAALQNDWMRIRSNLFEDQAWFARSAADLEEAPAPVTVWRAPPEPHPTLIGRWQVTSMLANGEPRNDPELIGSLWTFDPPRLTVRDGTGHETAYNFAVKGGDLAVTTPGGEDGWMKYALDADGLRIAFYDGLKGHPSSFEPEPGRSDPTLVVIRLVAAPI
jgi:hypothetical protein